MSTHGELTNMLEPFFELLDTSSIEAFALRVLGATLILVTGYWISKALQRILDRRLQAHDSGQPNAIQGVKFYLSGPASSHRDPDRRRLFI